MNSYYYYKFEMRILKILKQTKQIKTCLKPSRKPLISWIPSGDSEIEKVRE